MLENICNQLYCLSFKAYKKGEVPVAAIIVKNNKIISKAINKRKSSTNPLNHAEICAIIKACRKLKDWRLTGCDMYVTLKPCHMCNEVIKEVRLNNVFYFIDNPKHINLKTKCIKLNTYYSEKYSELLTNFFKKLR